MTDQELEQELLSIRKLRRPIKKRKQADIPINRLTKNLSKLSLEELEKLMKDIEEQESEESDVIP